MPANLDGSVDLSLHVGHLRLHLDDLVGNASGGALNGRQILLQPAHVASRRSEIRFQSGQRRFDGGCLLEQELVLVWQSGRIVGAGAAVRLNGAALAGSDWSWSRAAGSDIQPMIVGHHLAE